MNEFSKRVIQVANYYGINKPSEFARKTGFSHQVASNYLKGERVPNADALSLIKRLFDINGTWLLTGEGEMLETSNDFNKPTTSTDSTVFLEMLKMKDTVIKEKDDKIQDLNRYIGRLEGKITYQQEEINNLSKRPAPKDYDTTYHINKNMVSDVHEEYALKK